MMQRKWAFTALVAMMGSLYLAAMVSAGPYELSKDDLTDPKGIASQDVKSAGGAGERKDPRHQGRTGSDVYFPA